MPIPSVSTAKSKAMVRSAFGANQRPNRRFCLTLRWGKAVHPRRRGRRGADRLGHEDAGFGVHQSAAVKHDAAAIGTGETGDQIDGHRLARARTAEQSGDPGVVLEDDIEIEITELQGNVDADHAARSVASPDISPTYMSPDYVSRRPSSLPAEPLPSLPDPRRFGDGAGTLSPSATRKLILPSPTAKRYSNDKRNCMDELGTVLAGSQATPPSGGTR